MKASPLSGSGRRYGCLKVLKQVTRPRYLVFWDVETHVGDGFSEEPHRFRLGWACARTRKKGRGISYEWQYLDAPERFWAFLDTVGGKRDQVWCLSHNIAYDLWMSGGVDALHAQGYQVRSVYSNGAVSVVRVVRGKRSLTFLDTMNWFAGPLKEWGKETGLPKQDVDFRTATDEELKPYCHRDVEILVHLWDEWEGFLEEHDLGGTAVTVSGQAMKAYRYRFMEHSIHLHTNEEAIRLEREAYFGGRTECWWIGQLPDDRYTLVDVNAQYPFVMGRHVYPFRLAHHYRRIDPEHLAAYVRDWGVIAWVKVRVDQPLVPLRQKYFNIYPKGEFWTCLSSPEIELVLAKGEIVDCLDVALYETAPLFRMYVKYFTDLRSRYKAEGRHLWVRLVKLMQNSLYGKWGAKNIEWGWRVNDEGRSPGVEIQCSMESPDPVYSICLGPEIIESCRRTEAIYSFPAIAAFITAQARCLLWEYVELAGRENVFYMDTDSLLVNSAGRRRLASVLDEDRPGFLSVDYSAATGEIRQPKDYTIGDRRRRKGLTRNARQVSDTDWIDLQWPKIRGLLWAGQLSGYHNTIVRKQLRRNYRKGRVTPSGRVEPFEYREGLLPSGLLPY